MDIPCKAEMQGLQCLNRAWEAVSSKFEKLNLSNLCNAQVKVAHSDALYVNLTKVRQANDNSYFQWTVYRDTVYTVVYVLSTMKEDIKTGYIIMNKPFQTHWQGQTHPMQNLHATRHQCLKIILLRCEEASLNLRSDK